jgi:hypothetical protein
MIKVSRRNLFDRIGRYRIAAVILGVVFAQLLVVRFIREGSLPLSWVAIVFYIGYLTLLWAVLADYWTIYKGRRAVNKLIDEKISEGS